MSDLMDSIRISAAGMKVQGVRLRVVAENIANVDSTGTVKGGNPYRRKVILFEDQLDKPRDAHFVQVAKIERDKSPFKISYEPFHPLADDEGYIKRPNVNALIEMMDMREAQRSYEANLTVIENSRGMIQRTIDLLRG